MLERRNPESVTTHPAVLALENYPYQNLGEQITGKELIVLLQKKPGVQIIEGQIVVQTEEGPKMLHLETLSESTTGCIHIGRDRIPQEQYTGSIHFPIEPEQVYFIDPALLSKLGGRRYGSY
jgi:hypothetical protein